MVLFTDSWWSRLRACARSLRCIDVLAVLALSLWAALPSYAQSPVRGGVLSISLESDLPGIDPVVFASNNDKQAGILVYDTLLDVDKKGKLIPHLAESFESTPDATRFKITLRRGVKFHDDTPFDAAAVVAHFHRIMNPATRYKGLSALKDLESVSVTSDLEVTFKMKSPSAQFLSLLTEAPGMVVSPAAVKKYGENYLSNPVGAGPFVFKEWRRGSQIVFTRNSNYWKGPVHLDEVILRPMSDEQTRVASLKAGNLDIAMNAPAKDVIEARNDKKFQVYDPGSLGSNFLQINLTQPDVSDIRVRQALAHAIDRAVITKVITRGLSKVANTPFGSDLPPHELVDAYPQYDPAKSKALLAAYGKPVKLKFAISTSPLSGLLAQAIQQMWKKVGIETEITPLEFVQLIRASSTRQYQVMLYRFQGGSDPDRNVYSFFHSKGNNNVTALDNPEMDRLLEVGRATLDPAERLKVYRQVNNLLARELPYLFLYYFNNYIIAQANIKGIQPNPDGIIRAGTVWKER